MTGRPRKLALRERERRLNMVELQRVKAWELITVPGAWHDFPVLPTLEDSAGLLREKFQCDNLVLDYFKLCLMLLVFQSGTACLLSRANLFFAQCSASEVDSPSSAQNRPSARLFAYKPPVSTSGAQVCGSVTRGLPPSVAPGKVYTF